MRGNRQRLVDFSSQQISAPPRHLRPAVCAGILFLALFVGGCSSFSREWQRASRQPDPAGSIEGRWEGIWKSDSNGHTDPLRCLITKESDGRYRARFHAYYQRVLTFGYTAGLAGQTADGVYKFSGTADLGWYAGGVYEYAGQATGTNFFSTYRCPSDHGVFQMTRPK